MATSGTTKPKGISACSICLETPKAPKDLPCSHTFCEHCISEFIASTERCAGQKLTNYKCPVCRTVVTPLDPKDDSSHWAALLPNNDSMTELIDDISKSETNMKCCHVCRRQGKDAVAVNWCRECQEVLCEVCTNYHKFMKLSLNHEPIHIDRDHIKETARISEVSETCPVHRSKKMEIYCFDHNQLCCVLCDSVNHRKCENVRVLDDIIEDQATGVKTFKSKLLEIHSATETLLGGLEEEKSSFNESFEKIERNATKTIQTAKDNLDSLLISFVKNLHLKQDDHLSDLDSKRKEVEIFLETTNNAIETIGLTDMYGTLSQMFIQLEKLRPEIEKGLHEVVKSLNETRRKQVTHLYDDHLEKITIENLGSVDISKTDSFYLLEFEKLLGCSTYNFDNINVTHKQTIHLANADLRGGASINDNSICICDSRKVIALDIPSGKIIAEASVFSPKRLAFDKKNKVFYISCYSGYFYMIPFKNTFGSLSVLRSGGSYNGGVCLHSGSVYIAVNGGIERKVLGTNEKLQQIFDGKINCTLLNGLASDKKNNRLIYTSKEYEVVCNSHEGKEIFSYKDGQMRNVTSVTVHSHGLVFAGEEEGHVHVISEDGKQRKTLIEKCDKIQKICDVWLDPTRKTLFICGNQYIELYDISY